MINMMNMIFDELGLGIGLRWVRKVGGHDRGRSRNGLTRSGAGAGQEGILT